MAAPVGLVQSAPLAFSTSLRPGRGVGEVAHSEADFASFISSKLSDVAKSLAAGENAAAAGMQGGVPLQQVVETVMQAERQLHVALAIRDKVVSAYLEISRMPI